MLAPGIRRRLITQLVVGITLLAGQTWAQQSMSSLERARAQEILQVVTSEVKKHYYDPKFHGVDLDAKVADAKQQIEKATSFNMSMSLVASVLDTLNDSHTFFLPPEHAYRHSFEMQYQIVGNRCFVTNVRSKSDAEAKGVKPGDEILSINGFAVNRDDLWKMQYAFGILRPQPGLRLGLKDPSGSQRQVEVMAKVSETSRLTDLSGGGQGGDIWDLIRQEETEEHLARPRWKEYSDQVTLIKVPEFSFSKAQAEDMLDHARKHPNLILDLRGNPGGAVESLKWLVGGMFNKEIKISDRVGRKERKPEVASPARNPYLGKLIVLVDARSASAAELFARVIQLEKRGLVMGDRTEGAVMEASHYDERSGTDTVVLYGASITESDLIMSDGKSLEHVGVTPDELILPGADALANKRDPVLAHAVQSLGLNLSSEEAGNAFPYEWPTE